MKVQKNDAYPQFWFGFALGSAVCGLAAVAMGTKNGRDILKKTMRYIESVENEPDQIHKLTDIVTTLTGAVLEGGLGNIQKSVTTPVYTESKKTVETAKKTTPVEDDSTLGSIIDKMRSITSDRKMENKFFKKPSKK